MTTVNPGHRLGLLGRKVGMMRVFTDDGDAIPVTVLDVSNNALVSLPGEMTRQFPHHGPVILKPMNKNNFHGIRWGTC